MRRILGALLLASILTPGCDRTISHEKQVERDGTETTVKEKIVTQKSDGQVQVKKKETTKDSADGSTDVEVKTETK